MKPYKADRDRRFDSFIESEFLFIFPKVRWQNVNVKVN